MSIHIGKMIHEIVKKRGIKALAVAEGVNVSESSVYKIYHRETIDIDKLVRFSQFLDVNFFLPYFEQEPLKSMFKEQVQALNKTIAELNETIKARDQRIYELDRLNTSNEKMIGLLEELQGKYGRAEVTTPAKEPTVGSPDPAKKPTVANPAPAKKPTGSSAAPAKNSTIKSRKKK